MSLDIPQANLLHDVAIQEDMEDRLSNTCVLLGVFLKGIEERESGRAYIYHCVHLIPIDEQIDSRVRNIPCPEQIAYSFCSTDNSIVDYHSEELYLLPKTFKKNNSLFDVPIYMSPPLQEILSCLLDTTEKSSEHTTLDEVSKLIYQRYIERT